MLREFALYLAIPCVQFAATERVFETLRMSEAQLSAAAPAFTRNFLQSGRYNMRLIATPHISPRLLSRLAAVPEFGWTKLLNSREVSIPNEPR